MRKLKVSEINQEYRSEAFKEEWEAAQIDRCSHYMVRHRVFIFVYTWCAIVYLYMYIHGAP